MIPLVRPATEADARYVGAHLRIADQVELEVSGRAATPILVEAVEVSREAYALWADSEPVCLFGVVDEKYLSTRGRVWLVATDSVWKIKDTVTSDAHLWFDRWMTKWYPLGLHNVVDKRNKLHMDWIAQAGFKFGHTVDRNGVVFQYFSMEGPNV